MVYRYRGKTKSAIRDKYLRIFEISAAFIAGGAISILVLLHINHAYGLSGLKDPSGKGVITQKARNDTMTPNNYKGQNTTTNNGNAIAQQQNNQENVSNIRVSECGVSAPMHNGLSASTLPQLKKLSEYETVCDGGLTDTVSFFTGTPTTKAEVSSQALWVSNALKEYAKNGIIPLVFFEPTSGNGVLDIKAFSNGAYDVVLNQYFTELKSRGITDTMMGTWVPIPEGNIPVWGNVDPVDFAAGVTRVVQIQKSYFPSSKAAVMLQSMTYPSGTSWVGGQYKSLEPYVKDIPKGLIDSFGLQGFAWPPTSVGDSAQLDPKVFLRVDFAAEAANTLGTNYVWLNTGTFIRSLVISTASPFTVTQLQRQTVLDGIVQQARILKNRGFKTSVHLFAEDKSIGDEAIDWSYWAQGNPATSASTKVFRTFVHDLYSNGVGLWLYDSVK